MEGEILTTITMVVDRLPTFDICEAQEYGCLAQEDEGMIVVHRPLSTLLTGKHLLTECFICSAHGSISPGVCMGILWSHNMPCNSASMQTMTHSSTANGK